MLGSQLSHDRCGTRHQRIADHLPSAVVFLGKACRFKAHQRAGEPSAQCERQPTAADERVDIDRSGIRQRGGDLVSGGGGAAFDQQLGVGGRRRLRQQPHTASMGHDRVSAGGGAARAETIAVDQLRQFDDGIGLENARSPHLDRLPAHAAQNGDEVPVRSEEVVIGEDRAFVLVQDFDEGALWDATGDDKRDFIDPNRKIAHASLGRPQLFKDAQDAVAAGIEANRIKDEIALRAVTAELDANESVIEDDRAFEKRNAGP